MNWINYVLILAGAAVGFIAAAIIGVEISNMYPVMIGIIVGLVASFSYKYSKEKQHLSN